MLRTTFVNETENTVVEIDSDILNASSDTFINNDQFAQSGQYVVLSLNESGSTNSTKTIILFNLVTNTLTMHVFDTKLENKYISQLTVDQDGKVTVSLGREYEMTRYTLTSTVANFSEDMVVTEGGSSTFGNVNTYFIEGITTGIDLKITRTMGQSVPPNPPLTIFKFEFNNQVIEMNVAGFVNLYVVDLEGTANDAIYVRVSSFNGSSYFVNLFDPELTQIQGILTTEGIFSVDSNFVESLNSVITSANFINYFIYQISN